MTSTRRVAAVEADAGDFFPLPGCAGSRDPRAKNHQAAPTKTARMSPQTTRVQPRPGTGRLTAEPGAPGIVVASISSDTVLAPPLPAVIITCYFFQSWHSHDLPTSDPGDSRFAGRDAPGLSRTKSE